MPSRNNARHSRRRWRAYTLDEVEERHTVSDAPSTQNGQRRTLLGKRTMYLPGGDPIEMQISGSPAVLFMDLQNDVVHPAGALAGLDGDPDAIAGVLSTAATLLARVRTRDVPVIHVGVAFRRGFPDANSSSALMRTVQELGAMIEGSWGAEFHPSVSPGPGEPVVIKRGMSAFAGTDLDLLLRLKGVQTLVLCGISSNLVVDSTARAASDLGFSTVIVSDGCAGTSARLHEMMLEGASLYATLASAEEVWRFLEPLPARPD